MKLFRFPAAVSALILVAGILIVAVLSCPRSFAADLPAIVTSELEALEKKRQTALAVARKPLVDLTDNYVAVLERVKNSSQTAGEIKRVMGAEEEIKRVKAGAGLDEALEDPELAKLRKTYIGHLAKREVEVLGKVVQTEQGHANSLAKLVKELTQAGMIEEAKHVLGLEQAARESIKQLDAKTIAPSLIQRTTAQGVPEGFVLIPAGKFKMGDSLDGGQDAPVRTVDVSAFYMAKHEVTKALWDEVRKWGLKNGYTDLPEGQGKDSNHPVHSNNWWNVVKWCNARSEMEKLKPCYNVDEAIYKIGNHNNIACDWSVNGYRLSTEAEWERAARGGLEGKRFPWGDTISHKEANFTNGGYEAYQEGTREGHPKWGQGERPLTSPVGRFPSNGFGLCDMAGNVAEWCWDWYSPSSYTEGAADPRGPGSGSYRVGRGGSWDGSAISCRVAYRGYSRDPSGAFSFVGFRVARRSVP